MQRQIDAVVASCKAKMLRTLERVQRLRVQARLLAEHEEEEPEEQDEEEEEAGALVSSERGRGRAEGEGGKKEGRREERMRCCVCCVLRSGCGVVLACAGAV